MTEKEPLFRTSTKAGTGMTMGVGAMILLNEFFPGVVGGLSDDAKLVLGMCITTGLGWLIARLSKTARDPGAL